MNTEPFLDSIIRDFAIYRQKKITKPRVIIKDELIIGVLRQYGHLPVYQISKLLEIPYNTLKPKLKEMAKDHKIVLHKKRIVDVSISTDKRRNPNLIGVKAEEPKSI